MNVLRDHLNVMTLQCGHIQKLKVAQIFPKVAKAVFI